MPFVSFTTNHKLTLRQENEIARRTGELISILPGKKEENLMLHLEDNQIMYFRGEDIPCMMIAVKLYNQATLEAKKEFAEKLVVMIKETTNIEIDNIYVSFDEYPNWGKQGTLV
ncbi:phenylpyruvate tautomerase MIF-related protein [uncultured Thomasclavelia sp.]|uniref:tautomerase family protein n=1 Tax=uncultured Thomasclavelia sp. TaxID=3025759 RepID=UPI0025FD6F8B|nr:phenylpyruvate tautomerase MIF-related protein [uncultured Thomasclavelia sp.]